jgi:hypothetical protein
MYHCVGASDVQQRYTLEFHVRFRMQQFDSILSQFEIIAGTFGNAFVLIKRDVEGNIWVCIRPGNLRVDLCFGVMPNLFFRRFCVSHCNLIVRWSISQWRPSAPTFMS